jgi:hypothetical protein
MLKTISRRLMFSLTAALASCTGMIEGGVPGQSPEFSSDSNRAPGPGPNGNVGSGSGGSMPGSSTTDPTGGSMSALPAAPIAPGSPSRLRRLSRDELIATFEALTAASPSRGDLPDDERTEDGSLLTSGVAFVGPELGKLKQVLSEFATQIAPSMVRRSGCVLQQQAQRDCLSKWSLSFAELAFRRPLDAMEKAKLGVLFTEAGSSKEADEAAMRLALRALFFAPPFLYRPELGAPVAGSDQLRALSDQEIAVRLSYLATVAPPDEELLRASGSGLLKDSAERGRQFERLGGTDRGRRAMALFVLEWLGANESKVATKSEKYLTGLAGDFEQKIRSSAESAIRAVVFEGADPTLASLFSTKGYLTDSTVAALTKTTGTGISASGDSAATGRTGLLMHPYVISAHTKEDGASPFQIGIFIRQSLLCAPVPAPPENAADQAKENPPAGLSMREDLEFRTNAGATCAGCHSLFASLGYSFLPFDPVGRWIKQDPSGKPWDLSGQVETDSGPTLSFASPGELTEKLGGHPEAQDCFSQGALRWVLGRAPVPEEKTLVEAVRDVSRRTRGSVPAIFKTIVESPSFVQTVAQR